MSVIIRSLVAAPFVGIAFCLAYIVNNPVPMPEDFKVEKVRYKDALVKAYGITTRYYKIEIDTGSKIYSLYPDMLGKVGVEQAAELLSKSSEATIWVEETEGLHIVRGLKSEYLHISPTQGVRVLERRRNVTIWCAVILFLIGAGLYFYFKRYYDMDWKLSLKW